MLITLTSDMGLKDYYVASVKGTIFSQLPDAKIVDVSHNIPPFDIVHAAFVIKNTFKEFPKNTRKGRELLPVDKMISCVIVWTILFEDTMEIAVYSAQMRSVSRMCAYIFRRASSRRRTDASPVCPA